MVFTDTRDSSARTAAAVAAAGSCSPFRQTLEKNLHQLFTLSSSGKPWKKNLHQLFTLSSSGKPWTKKPASALHPKLFQQTLDKKTCISCSP
jgi:hypothetical protein